MPSITLAQAEAQLALYLTAEAKVLQGQSYEIAGRKLTRANLAEIQAGIATWQARTLSLERATLGRSRSRTVIVRD